MNDGQYLNRRGFMEATAAAVLTGAMAACSIALALLEIGVIGVKGKRKQGVSLPRQAVGLLLLVLAIAILLVVSWETSLLAFEAAKHWARPSQPRPAMDDQFLVAMGWVILTAFIGLGLWRWTVWSCHRCLCWAIAVLFVCPASLLLFVMLHMYGFRVTN